MSAARVIGAMLFASGGFITLGFTLALFYETIAYATGMVPTISNVTAGTIIAHRTVALVAVALAFLTIGLLLAHFTDWLP